MSYELQTEGGLTVMGIAVRTSNGTAHHIGELWRRFHTMGNQEAIAARESEAIYSVYCEYEGDYTQKFTVVIGCAVAPDAEVPEGMKKVAVEGGEFAVFPVTGELPAGVFRTWSQIWEMRLERRYQADFDRYQDGAVTIHVGVR
ncbi:MAG TPA: GyrI-like domain-containing protein [Granulicella sp.]|nr:GyrI-like domain-containing protein [Granulicella sp.]